MSYEEVMRLPIQTFWLMNSSVGRLLAEKEVRLQRVSASVNSTDAFKETRESLIEEMGEMFKTSVSNPMNAKRDEEGFAELKALAAIF